MADPRRNIELKARVADLNAAARAAEALGATRRALLVQTDTYFHARQGRLKLREIHARARHFSKLTQFKL